MTRKEVITFMAQHPACHLATIDEGGIPHVRGMLMYRIDGDGIVFHTGTFKNVYDQLTENPNIELCFNDFEKGVQIRISGIVEEIADIKVKKEIVADPTRAFLRPWIEKEGYDKFAVFRLPGGRAKIWTMQTNFEPCTYIDI